MASEGSPYPGELHAGPTPVSVRELVQATSGGGMVTVTVNGHKHLQKIAIDPEVVSKEDVGMLQDLILAAVNDAHRKVDEAMKQKMGGLLSGLRLPGL